MTLFSKYLPGPVRIPRVLVAREVDHPIDVVLGDRLAHEFDVADVADDERGPEQSRQISRLQGVEHHDVVAAGAQGAHRVRADVAGSSGDQHGHGE
jgi:hypothetical protein